MSTSMRRAGIGAAALLGLLAWQNAAQAQFSFGMTRFGFNPSNPFVAQQQFLGNLQANAAAIRFGAQIPAALPYLAPAFYPPFSPGTGGYLNPYAMGYGFGGVSPYMGGGGFGGNPYIGGGYGATNNVYSSSYGGSNPYLSSYAMGYGGYGNSSVGPGITLMGTADVMRAYGTVITSQEQARIMREQWYEERIKRKKQKFDLDMYIKANTPTAQELREKTAKQQLRRIQGNSNPAEIVDGRALNFLLDDIATHPGKTPVSDIPLDDGILNQLNVQPKSNSYSLGLLRNGGKLTWPTALVQMLPADVRKDMSARAQALAQSVQAGKEPDANAIRDLRLQVDRADTQLKKMANDFDTPDYMAAGRFLGDLQNSLRAISSGAGATQVQFDQMVAKGDIKNLADLVRVMGGRGWRFGPALPNGEGAYRALYSGLVSYDVALNQMVATNEP